MVTPISEIVEGNPEGEGVDVSFTTTRTLDRVVVGFPLRFHL